MESSDYGASFSGEVQVAQEGSGAQVKALAGEVQTGGEPMLFYGGRPGGRGGPFRDDLGGSSPFPHSAHIIICSLSR